MDLRAAADPLYDLLSEIAAFVEVNRTQLVGFLDQVTFGDLLAVTRAPGFDTHDSGIFGRGGRYARFHKLRDEGLLLVHRNHQKKPAPAGGIQPRDCSGASSV